MFRIQEIKDLCNVSFMPQGCGPIFPRLVRFNSRFTPQHATTRGNKNSLIKARIEQDGDSVVSGKRDVSNDLFETTNLPSASPPRLTSYVNKSRSNF